MMDKETLEDVVARLIDVDRRIAFINERYLEKSEAIAHTLEARTAIAKALGGLESERHLPPLLSAWLGGYSIGALAQDYGATERSVEEALRAELGRLSVDMLTGDEEVDASNSRLEP